ncbi:pre-miRNA 5'-monophosphate methyltransferase isoform X2 [Hetaerina americana]|uniref:pre-miRNA 5'-monophosphate methyltransferase isoform X2 n=1 Tax=Hetaerina americana TaxID=62018 RepID=UPI003A7F4A16
MSSLTYLGTDPGASKYGNFINYYDFHPAKERLDGFPTNIWCVDKRDTRYACLDVGCNSGELTQNLWEFISANLRLKSDAAECGQIADCPKQSSVDEVKCMMLGLDLDQTLILRASEANTRKDLIHFKHCDIMNDVEVEQVVGNFFGVHNQKLDCDHKFDVVFLFSVTMWIHLNYGDPGLSKLLCTATKLSRNLIVIEPQLWKCYSAAKRLVDYQIPLF